MNPSLTIDEINAFLASRMRSRNDQSLVGFFGKSPNQIQNWLYAPFSELTGLRIQVPGAFEISPVTDLDRAFPALGQQIASTKFACSGDLFARIIRCRFAGRFLSFWGFVAFSSGTGVLASPFATQKHLVLQPLMREVFQF